VFKDCAPTNREADPACFTQTMRCLKVLLPEQKFADVINEANRGHEPKVKSEDFEIEPEPREAERHEPEREQELMA